MLFDYDWPCRELRQHGGDSMLGELLRHTGGTMVDFSAGVCINANARGEHSSAPRRGQHGNPLGVDLLPHQDCDFQQFEVTHANGT